MPYIDPVVRSELDHGDRDPTNAGELNYIITNKILEYLENQGESYQTYNDVLGVLEGAKLELMDRKIRNYEDLKIRLHGDVYSGNSSNTNLAWAGGFFEGEGCFYAHKYPKRKDGSQVFRVNATLVQNDKSLLEQFTNVVKCGMVYKDRSWHVWKTSKKGDAKKIFDLLRPWLGERRQNKFIELYEKEQQQDFRRKCK